MEIWLAGDMEGRMRQSMSYLMGEQRQQARRQTLIFMQVTCCWTECSLLYSFIVYILVPSQSFWEQWPRLTHLSNLVLVYCLEYNSHMQKLREWFFSKLFNIEMLIHFFFKNSPERILYHPQLPPLVLPFFCCGKTSRLKKLIEEFAWDL